MRYLSHTLLGFALLLLSACNLEKEVAIDLPDYFSEPVVECYLEPGKPYRLLLTRSFGYFEVFDLGDPLSALITDAVVTIRYQGEEITLLPSIYFDPLTRKFANYGSELLVPDDLEHDFTLTIQLADGHHLEAVTRLLPVVPIDSVVAQFNSTDSLARVLTYFTENPLTTNYYRRMIHLSTLDSFPLQDFVLTDDFFQTDRGVFGTGFDFVRGDTLINTLVHLDQAAYNYLNTLNQSITANLNPFGQPGLILSNIQGSRTAIGLFTGLRYDRDTLVIP